MVRRAWATAIVTMVIAWCAAAASAVEVHIPETTGDGSPGVVKVESVWYRCEFNLAEQGSASALVFKPLNHDLRAENYYSNHNNLFRGWIRLAEPKYGTSVTRQANSREFTDQTRRPATCRIVSRGDGEVVLEFAWSNAPEPELPWMQQIAMSRRITLRDATPAIEVTEQVANLDTEPREVLFDSFNSVSLGRVKSGCYMPGPEGKLVGVDLAEESGSRFLAAEEPTGAWLGGVNAEGLGAGFSYDWADIDAMQLCMWKTVGTSYHVAMRRRRIEPGATLTFHYTFMPMPGMGTLDGMNGDLAGGVLIGQGADYLDDVRLAGRGVGDVVPVLLTLHSGRSRAVQIAVELWTCGKSPTQIGEAHRSATLEAGRTTTVQHDLKLSAEGLTEVRVIVRDGRDNLLTIAKPIVVGRSRQLYVAREPEGVKHGERDAGISLGASTLNEQFRTLDRKKVTPHLPLLNGHVAGTVKALFATAADQTLGHVRELVQRGDFTFDYLALTKVQMPQDTLATGDVRELRKMLAAFDGDVLVTMGMQWQVGLGPATISQILGRVADDGLGVVLPVRDFNKQPLLQTALEESAEPVDDATDPLPACGGDVPTIRRWKMGKGRIAVVMCNWSNYRDGGEAMLGNWSRLKLGRQQASLDEVRWRGFEYSYGYLDDVIRWAAGKPSPVTITSIEAEQDDRVRIAVNNGGDPLAATMQVTVRDPRWEATEQVTSTVELPRGGSDLYLDMPLSGPAMLEITLKGAAGRTMAFATGAVAGQRTGTITVDPASTSIRASQTPTITLRTSSSQASDATLDVRIIDRFGRLVWQQRKSIRLTSEVLPTPLEITGIEPRCVYHEIVARLLGPDGRRVAQATAHLMLLPDRSPLDRRFMLGMADGAERKALHIQSTLQTGRDLGILLQSHGHWDPILHFSGGYRFSNNYVTPMRGRYPIPGVKAALDAGKLIMHPPLLPDAEAISRLKEAWQKRAAQDVARGSLMLQLDDERRMSGEFDRHPQTLAGFRARMKEIYGSVEALNRSWASQWSSFDEVTPKLRNELDPAGTLAPWLDFRMYIGDVLGEYYMKLPAQWAAELGDVPAGEYGIYEPGDAWPVDWSRYARWYRTTSRYDARHGVLQDLFASFAPQSTHGVWMGYHMLDVSPGRRLDLWRCLLDGGRHAMFWAMVDNGFWGYGVNTSDQRPTRGYAALAKLDIPDLTGGIDQVLIASHPQHDGVAVAYSFPSWLIDRFAQGQQTKMLIENLGLQHRYVRLDDLKPDDLSGLDGFRLLIMQGVTCVSPDQVAALAKWVAQGGVLLMTGEVGTRDLHGRPHDGGAVMTTLAGSSPRVIRYDLSAKPDDAERTTCMKVLADAARKAGIAPRMVFSIDGQPRHDGETWIYQSPSGQSQYVARYLDGGEPVSGQVTLSGAERVYDVRAGRAFTGPTFDTRIEPGEMKLYAVVPYRVNTVIVTPKDASIAAGTTADIAVRIRTDGADADLHAFRVAVLGPDGSALPAHHDVLLAPGGELAWRVPVALNAAPGRYTLLARDAVTGVEGSAAIDVTAPQP